MYASILTWSKLLTHRRTLTTNFEVIKAMSFIDGFSDHKLIPMNLELAYPHRTSYPKIIRDFNKAYYIAINAELQGFSNSFVESFWQRAIETNWTMFKDKLLELINKYVPRIVIRSNAHPWFNTTWNNIRNKKKRFSKQAKKFDTYSAWLRYSLCAKQYISFLKVSKRKFYTANLP